MYYGILRGHAGRRKPDTENGRLLKLWREGLLRHIYQCQGNGDKKRLRSLSIPIATIAAAIENADDKTLISLPSIGKRMSQQIIAELKGKLQSFAASAEAAGPSQAGFRPFQTEALEILIAWGEKRNEAMELVELACRKHPDINSAEALVPLVYRLKQGVEV